jgi:DNA-binding NarL/FixJ family response regulator
MKDITLLVVSDEAIPRLGLNRLLASEVGFTIKGDCAARQAASYASKVNPEVVIIHAEAIQTSCVQLICSLRKGAPNTGILVLSRETNHAYLGMLLAAGALGYVLLQASPRELASAIRAVARGRRYLDRKLGNEIFELFLRQADSSTRLLSNREQQVLKMLAYGHTLVEIARRLSISRKSIETYRARIREKLGLQTRAEIVRYALETGILTGKPGRTS